jgi:hypothetical protein
VSDVDVLAVDARLHTDRVHDVPSVVVSLVGGSSQRQHHEQSIAPQV